MRDIINGTAAVHDGNLILDTAKMDDALVGNDIESPWLYKLKPQKKAKLKIYCFPYAGGSASIFKDWPKYLGDDFEVVAISFPGRWLRSHESSISCMHQLITEITEAIQFDGCTDFIFFGHSMGGGLCYNVAQELQNEGAMMPQHIFVSACESPSCTAARKLKRKPIHELNENELLEHIRGLAGTPSVLLDDEAMKQRVFKSMVPDLMAIDNCVYQPSRPLPVNITAFSGKQDDYVNVDNARNWQDFTSQNFNFNLLAGGHFYINDDERSRVLNTIKRTMEIEN